MNHGDATYPSSFSLSSNFIPIFIFILITFILSFIILYSVNFSLSLLYKWTIHTLYAFIHVRYKTKPKDAVDALCMEHDKCYDNNKYLNCKCDADFVTNILIVIRNIRNSEFVSPRWPVFPKSGPNGFLIPNSFVLVLDFFRIFFKYFVWLLVRFA